jgi:hypothetical protein
MSHKTFRSKYYKGQKNFRGANLAGLDLTHLYLNWADFRNADLRKANLEGAILDYSDLRGANLERANLEYTELEKARFEGARLFGTILSPRGKLNKDVEGFRKNKDGLCIGYRTQNSYHVDYNFTYEVGKRYKAPVFSVGLTVCHPGLYVMKTKLSVQDRFMYSRIIQVLFKPEHCHKAGDKWRVKEFYVNKLTSR